MAAHDADVSLILLELGGAFTAAIAVEQGRIVDGLGGSSGPLGAMAGGALDGEVAFLAGEVTKRMIFSGGALAVAGTPDARAEEMADATTPHASDRARRLSRERSEGCCGPDGVRALGARVVLSGRLARVATIREVLVATRRASCTEERSMCSRALRRSPNTPRRAPRYWLTGLLVEARRHSSRRSVSARRPAQCSTISM